MSPERDGRSKDDECEICVVEWKEKPYHEGKEYDNSS